jgi:hypothetical protein
MTAKISVAPTATFIDELEARASAKVVRLGFLFCQFTSTFFEARPLTPKTHHALSTSFTISIQFFTVPYTFATGALVNFRLIGR